MPSLIYLYFYIVIDIINWLEFCFGIHFVPKYSSEIYFFLIKFEINRISIFYALAFTEIKAIILVPKLLNSSIFDKKLNICCYKAFLILETNPSQQ